MSGIAQAIAEWATAAGEAAALTEIAKRMIRVQRYPADMISEATTLDMDTVLRLAKELGITLPETFIPLHPTS